MRVLIVDDYPGAADVACVLVRLLGHEPQAAKNGLDAVAQVEAFAPDVIVLDLGLPDIDGYEVARRIRTKCGKRVFIAAMTGWGNTEHHVHSVASGIDMHVLKPVSAENLTKIIEAAQRRVTVGGDVDRA